MDNPNWFQRLIGFENSRRLMWLVCFFKGHNFKRGEFISDGTGYYGRISPDYCDRCVYTSDEIDLEDRPFELPSLLNRAYGWLVERDWRWFAALDAYIFEHHAKHMPRWWNY